MAMMETVLTVTHGLLGGCATVVCVLICDSGVDVGKRCLRSLVTVAVASPHSNQCKTGKMGG